jgi:hypothetical protein
MTKTAYRVVRAWENGNSCKTGNTWTDGDTVYLFGKSIIKRENGKVFIRTAGYPTKTTKDRLNKLDGVQVHTSRGVLYLNGEVWENHEEWTEI